MKYQSVMCNIRTYMYIDDRQTDKPIDSGSRATPARMELLQRLTFEDVPDPPAFNECRGEGAFRADDNPESPSTQRRWHEILTAMVGTHCI